VKSGHLMALEGSCAMGLDFFFPDPESFLKEEVGVPDLVFEGAEKRQLGCDRLAVAYFLFDLIENRPALFEGLLEAFLKAQIGGDRKKRKEKKEASDQETDGNPQHIPPLTYICCKKREPNQTSTWLVIGVASWLQNQPFFWKNTVLFFRK
jgi:hypothetical protein